MLRRDWLRAVASGTAALAIPAALRAQGAYPVRPIRWVVPYPAGGPVDAIGRKLAEVLAPRLGQPIVIDNRGGANGSIGTGEVARAAPDGYTMLLTITDSLINNAVLFRKLPYDPQKDFQLLMQVGASSPVLMVHADVPATNLEQLIALAKRASPPLSYGSWGAGSFGHLLMENLKREARIDVIHVPYRGAAPALQDLVGKQVSMTFGPPNVAVQFAAKGQVKPIAVAGDEPLPALPGVRTFAAQGFREPIYRTRLWMGLAVPAATPIEISRRVWSEMDAALKLADVQRFINNVGFDVIGNTPEQFTQAFRAEFPVVTRMIRELDVEMQ
jgi:tripartite-type tricarboxylate transporter receptor subunit TctC